jgi:pilus assembly protein CpaF
MITQNGRTPLGTTGSTGVAGLGADRAAERELRTAIREAVSRLLDESQLLTPRPEHEERIRALIRQHVTAHQRRTGAQNAPGLRDPATTEQRLFDALLRLGPLEPFLRHPEIEEIAVNGPQRVFVIESGRKRLLSDVTFDDDDELRALVKRVIGPLGKRLDESSPMVDVRLPDGSRLNACIPPATTRWTCVSIRKFILRAQSLEELVALGPLTESAAQFLDAAVQGGINFLVSGGTGSGKTTLLNCLGASIRSLDERVLTVEEVPELTLEKTLPDAVALQARPGNLEGAGEIRIRDLVRNALRMRPSRIIVGECRGAEALDMLQAMNSGHDGSMSTLHANSPRDAVDRLITMASMAEERLPVETLQRMVARTVELVVQLRYEPRSGRRRVSHIWEIVGQEGGVIAGHDLWAIDPARARLQWTGLHPRCLTKIADRGVVYTLPASPERS